MVALKDIIKSLTHSVRNATFESDGQSTCDMIELYLDEQTSANIGMDSSISVDNASLDKFNAELFSLYESTIVLPLSQHQLAVSTKPEVLRYNAQHYIQLRSLRALLPLLKPEKVFSDKWWNVLKPILTTASYTNKIKREARLIISDALIMEQQQEIGNVEECVYFNKMVNLYLEWAEQKAAATSVVTSPEEETTRQHQALLDLEQDEWSGNLTTILLSVGASETKQFFLLLDKYFLSSKHRLQIVYLLSEFMRRRRTHLHEILETPLFHSMLKSLMYDNSTTLIAISVTNLIMLLPRICTSLPKFLPQLFYIFARAICWDQLRDLRKKQQQQYDAFSSFTSSTSTTTRTVADGWDCVDYTFSKLSAPPSNPQTGAFFTSLYGLYPCNFLKFLHKPYAYFKENEFICPEEFDEETFKGRTIPQVTRHMLHPNLVVMDAQSELTDKTRWMKMEPPDVIAQIMGLDLTNAASRVAFTDEHEKEQLDLLDESLWDSNQSTTSGKSIDEQHKSQQKEEEKKSVATTAAVVTEKDGGEEEEANKPVMISNIVALHKALKSGAEVLVGDDVWDAGLLQEEPSISSNTESPSASTSAVPAATHPVEEEQKTSTTTTREMSSETKLLLAALKREVLLLRNELNFELFLKQQHLQHIGRLHREHVLDSSVEAERQQLYNTTRMLKAQLNQTTSALEKLRAESALTKTKHIKWEDEQSGKLRNYREQRREWQTSMTRVEHQVADFEKQLREQKLQLDSARQRIFELENELKTLEPTLSKMTENEHRVKQLTQQMLLWEEDTSHMEEQKRYIKGLLSQWWSMEELVASLQTENRRLQEEQIQKEEKLEKLKVQAMEYQQKMESFSKTFGTAGEAGEKAAGSSGELERVQKTLDELKARLEELEMEKLEWSAQIEAYKHKASLAAAKTAAATEKDQQVSVDEEEAQAQE